MFQVWNNLSSSKHFRVFCIGILGLVYGFPAFYLFVHDVSLVAVANESLSYRYFYSFRIWNGENESLFTAQAQLLNSMHILFQWVMDDMLMLPADNLRARMEMFGYATLVINWVIGLLAIAVLFLCRSLSWMDRLVCSTVSLFVVYGSRSGISAAMTPDYYGMEASLVLLVLTITLVLWKQKRVLSPEWAFPFAGFLLGILAATKITLLSVGFLPILPIVYRGSLQGFCLLRWMVCFGAVGFCSAALFWGLSYLFDSLALKSSMQLWAAFVRNPGGEPSFWTSLFFPWSPAANQGADYTYALFGMPVFMGVFGAAMLYVIRNREGRHSLVGGYLVMACLMGLHIVALIRRPAGTTLWEMSIVFATVAALSVLMLGKSRTKTVLSLVFLIFLCFHTSFSGFVNFKQVIPIANYQSSTKTIWEVHDYLKRQGEEVVVLIPDNNYTAGTVEEGILKGMSDVPTWNISHGAELLTTIAPGIRFTQNLLELPATSAVMWIDIEGKKSLVEKFPVLKQRVEQLSHLCKIWEIQTWAWWPRRITVCLKQA